MNIELALGWLESTWAADPDNFRIDHRLIRELHRRVTETLSLESEGDATPGQYRLSQVRISGSARQPPEPGDVYPLMDELVQFLNQPDAAKYDLIKIALAHHRFAWIHPFSNGNGRTVRLLTYALLLNYEWLGKNVFAPAIAELHEKNSLSDREQSILMRTLITPTIQNSDIRGKLSQVRASQILGDLRARTLLIPSPGTERKYQLGIEKSPLLRTVIRQLDRLDFLPIKGEI